MKFSVPVPFSHNELLRNHRILIPLSVFSPIFADRAPLNDQSTHVVLCHEVNKFFPANMSRSRFLIWSYIIFSRKRKNYFL